MKELKRFKKIEDKALAAVYDLLSKTDFDIEIIDGQMNVWYSHHEIRFDCEEGLVIVPDEYIEEFDERQDEYDNLNNQI